MERPSVVGLALGALALAGGLAWLAASLGGSEAGVARPAPRVARAAGREGGIAGAALDAPASAAAQGARGVLLAGSASAPAPAVAARVFQPPPEDGITVRVLRGHPARPVPFAEVAYAPSPPKDARGRLEQQAGYFAWNRDVGEPAWYRADAEGRLLLPRPRGGNAQATCSDAGDFGLLYLSETAREEVLHLQPDRALEVRVVRGAEREPVAGAHVGIRYSYLSIGDSAIVDRRRTDADGLVRFEHVAEHARWYWPHDEELALVLLGIWNEAPAAGFDPWAPDRVELVLPPSSRLAVQVVEADGAPPRDPVLVSVALQGEKPFSNAGRVAAEVAADGRAVFEQVEPGIDVAIVASRALGWQSEPVVVRSAPAGDSASAVVTLGARAPTLVARVLDAGAPAAERGVRVSLRDLDSSRAESLGARTDADGRLRCALDPGIAASRRLELTVADASDHEPRWAWVRLEGPLAATELALGDLELGPAPCVAAGRVVDAAGLPVAGATVMAQSPRDERGRRRYVGRGVTDAAGAFLLSGSFDAATVTLHVGHPGFTDADLEVAAGARELELVLRTAAGRLRGSVLLDTEWMVDFAVVRARMAGDAEWTHEAEVGRPGFFEIASLAPGRYDVGVGMESETEMPVVVRDVEVEAGRVTDDPRLQEIDLRGSARLLTLRVVDAAGEPVQKGRLWTRPPGALEWGDDEWFEKGVVHVFTTHAELEVYATAEGCRAAFIPGVREPREIVLDASVQVRFHWREPPASVPDGFFLSSWILHQEPGMPEVTRGLQPAAEPGAGAIVHLPAAGRSELVWSFGPRWRPGSGPRGRTERFQQAIDVRDRADVQDIGVSMPTELRAAIEAAAATRGGR